MATYLITGSSRGLGLAICKLLAAKSPSEVHTVVAAFRTHTTSLEELSLNSPGRMHSVHLDVTDEKHVLQAVKILLGSRGLDVLINCAGIQNLTQGGIQAMVDLDHTFKTNVAGAHFVTKAFLPLLEDGSLKKIINISSGLGSIGLAGKYRAAPFPAYNVSKAALNMLTVQYALQLAEDGFTVVAISPGWIRTDLGGAEADLEVEASAKGVFELVSSICQEDNGKFLNIDVPDFVNSQGFQPYTGGEIPW
ncbi:hypothetical protein NM208_g5443 [Fusarium decemcellulare]|uniref:Uncharacterized protein n=1 Tax=Fusarium decemcellulare TaxID=57161 RepID=A0ACC1SGW0_9HYPO|nr:hypothetical protein NM208_g5443 [Fusarium decemcellulare]